MAQFTFALDIGGSLSARLDSPTSKKPIALRCFFLQFVEQVLVYPKHRYDDPKHLELQSLPSTLQWELRIVIWGSLRCELNSVNQLVEIAATYRSLLVILSLRYL